MRTGPTPDPGLAQTLGQAFETFDAIRQRCRRHESRSPDLFAAFASAAAAAVDGRDAVLTAGTWPTPSPAATEPGEPTPGAGPYEVADSIAASAAVLAAGLDHAAGLAKTPQDRRACREAADFARQIHQLLADGDDAHAR